MKADEKDSVASALRRAADCAGDLQAGFLRLADAFSDAQHSLREWAERHGGPAPAPEGQPVSNNPHAEAHCSHDFAPAYEGRWFSNLDNVSDMVTYQRCTRCGRVRVGRRSASGELLWDLPGEVADGR